MAGPRGGSEDAQLPTAGKPPQRLTNPECGFGQMAPPEGGLSGNSLCKGTGVGGLGVHSRKQHEPSLPGALGGCERFVETKTQQSSGRHIVGTLDVTVEVMHTGVEVMKAK